ncbi:SsrA-binding protein SmpB [Campylobacter hyointestinalis]|uniref:SsrA-binding protein SmpB n=1 Tax=Campylobacter hyointestinalis TaxID=198 RepID=UPI0007C8C5F1|nr:SsrA-binding protein SmpB [Campylobacter hyointestinalis]ANE32732.1 SsrA-binding protein [Campylobacter hyointestinalis subsp. hyointestinalis LMG 9260]MBT0611650.1 SsrA-binding protein SmpB [Campylobacter hyointestinalis subsp. hyointestinalis]MDY2998850.1 SsrA-binding protein SmpB [Campylobacter hyointestinalis]PPB69172.1 SsrA-binding protein [Campylobacter hyointestinalis subsp. hyointestinalis]PPB73489.1 SsrA-binding protein [Campylobacter hyointestinalis subsp. hyointestinalis]
MAKDLARNKKAFHDYTILETFEAGIVLKGSEVKALRAGRANLKDSFVRIIRGEIFLLNAHISHLNTTNMHFKPDERAPRKLLMHRRQIDKLFGQVSTEGLTIVALSLYLSGKNIVKVTVALAKGKNLHDKREAIKKKEANLEARAAIKRYL